MTPSEPRPATSRTHSTHTASPVHAPTPSSLLASPLIPRTPTRLRWCPDYDRFRATSTSGQTTLVPFTVSHYGPGLPTAGLSVSLARTDPYDACSTISGVTRGGNISTLSSSVSGAAYLSSIYSCHFIYKTINAEQAGASLAVIGNAAEQLFYMAAAEDRQADSLALDIPSILIGVRGRDWLTSQLAAGVLIEIGGDMSRCTGGRLLTESSGTFRSGPPGQRYCSWQQCQWHISIPTDDVIVVSFSRFSLECITRSDGAAYDYVKLYDGATANAPLLHTFYCNTYQTVVTTDRDLLVHFYTDDLFNFDGFEATYSSGVGYCAQHTTCDTCSASSICGWCLESHTCLPATGPQAVCALPASGAIASGGWAANASSCCAAGWAGAQCSRCAPGYFGSTCAPCLCGAGGTCDDGITGVGTCSCAAGWDGPLCDTCQPNHWGSECTPCGCSGGSTCDTGINGTGCQCLPNYFGSQCAACSCVGDARCDAGISGSGACSCDLGFTGVSTGCGQCSASRYGPTCAACDCPASTACAEGINGNGRCNCTEPSCEVDASLAFLQLIATAEYHLPRGAPYRHLPLGAPIAGTVTYGTVTIPDEATELDVLLAPSQWGARVQVSTAHNGGNASVVCDALLDVDAVQSASMGSGEWDRELEARNASEARAILDGTLPTGSTAPVDGGGAWLVPSTSARLLRACTFRLFKGDTSLSVLVTSPGGVVSQSYSIPLSFPPSDDCRLASLEFAYRMSGSSAILAPSRPDFAPSIHTYYAALSDIAIGVDLVATTMHSLRCGGVHDGTSCVRPARMRLAVLSLSDEGHTERTNQTSDNTIYDSNLTASVSVPAGRSIVVLSVEPESQMVGPSCVYNLSVSVGLLGASEYRVQVGFVASGDVADYTPSRKEAMAVALATQAAVNPSRVSVGVSAASVNVAADISLPSPAAQSAANTAVSSVAGTASALTSFFSTNSIPGVTVLAAPSVQTSVVALVSQVTIGVFRSAPTLTVNAIQTEILTVMNLQAASGATGAEASTLFPASGNLTQTLPHEATAALLTPTVASGASFTVTCASCTNLPVGDTHATVTVTAEDMVTLAIVTIVITRAPSSDCTLASLHMLSEPTAEAATTTTGGSSALARPPPPPPAAPWTANSSVFSELMAWIPPASTRLQLGVANENLYLRAAATPAHPEATMSYRFGMSPMPATPCDTSSGCTQLAVGSPSSAFSCPIGGSYLQVTVTAQAGEQCTYRVSLSRTRSSDTSLSEVGASLIVDNRVDPTTSISTSLLSSTLCPDQRPCYAINLLNSQPDILFRTTTNHSVFCGLAAHACVSAASVQLTAPRLSWIQHGTESGIKGTLEAVMAVPVGMTTATLTVTAEDLSTETFHVVVRRAPSTDAVLRTLNLRNADLITSIADGTASGRFDISMHAGYSTLRIDATGTTGSAVTIGGYPVPVSVQLNSQTYAELTLNVVAEDGSSGTNYTLAVTCSHCGTDGGGGGGGGGGTGGDGADGPIPTRILGSPLMLMLVLLIAASTLCCLSLLVCLRMQCLRHAQRQEMLRRPPDMPILAPEQVLARLEPYLTHMKGLPEDSPFCDEQCAICISELEADDELTILPCHHCFHKECISGWLVHKGLSAPCPLCKRLVAPDIVGAFRASNGLTVRLDGAEQPGVEMQPLAPQRASTSANAGAVQRAAGAVSAAASVSAAAEAAMDLPVPEPPPSPQSSSTAMVSRAGPSYGDRPTPLVSASAAPSSRSSSPRSSPRASTPTAWADPNEVDADNGMAPLANPPPSPPASAAASEMSRSHRGSADGVRASGGVRSGRTMGRFSPRSGRIAPTSSSSPAAAVAAASPAEARPGAASAGGERGADEPQDDDLIGRVGSWIRSLTPDSSPVNSPSTSERAVMRVPPLGTQVEDA